MVYLEWVSWLFGPPPHPPLPKGQIKKVYHNTLTLKPCFHIYSLCPCMYTDPDPVHIYLTMTPTIIYWTVSIYPHSVQIHIWCPFWSLPRVIQPYTCLLYGADNEKWVKRPPYLAGCTSRFASGGLYLRTYKHIFIIYLTYMYMYPNQQRIYGNKALGINMPLLIFLHG